MLQGFEKVLHSREAFAELMICMIFEISGLSAVFSLAGNEFRDFASRQVELIGCVRPVGVVYLSVCFCFFA